ncbi:putative hydrolase [Ascoidea rubescens DSM 1968]|uniref:Nit protein n=1 Tax=Ascoidea rubescens DSM 1968 TaxID=1344418 RepID=A0A1D2VNN3_9ASCO|nr:Nit protein [Ascoidea rubescens DSM 1968]ODV63213.1 Nit protein [Ascoidea rubescens DSM 1968]
MVRVAVGQLSSTSSLSTNVKAVLSLIHRALSVGAEILFLPEASDYISRDAKHSLKIARSIEDSVFVKRIGLELQSLDTKHRSLEVCVGVHEPNNVLHAQHKDNGTPKVKNTLLYFSKAGRIVSSYQKLHLYDVNITNGPIMKESNSVERGAFIHQPFQSAAGVLGLGICYDVRFPELALKLRSRGAQILTFPSAFNTKTGAAHWELLGRARAIDTQCFVVMPAQKGKHNVNIEDDDEGNVVAVEPTGKKITRVSYGHSCIIDPWGTVLAQCSDVNYNNDEPDLCVADVDLAALKKVREDIPLWDHRRTDIFGEYLFNDS